MRGKPHRAILVLSALAGILVAQLALSQTVQQIISAEQRRVQQAQAAQDEIDTIVETTRSRFDEYQALLKEIEGLQVYNRVLQSQIDDQERELSELRTSIDQVSFIERQILPLMTRMISGLESFVELDVPFLESDRLARIAELNQLITRSDVTTAEQFRKVMEAWQIENDYGTTIETYTGELQIDGTTREVDFLRVGRVALLYLTPDGELAGAWDQRSRTWIELGADYRNSIRQGLRVARQQVAPELFIIPVAPPEEG